MKSSTVRRSTLSKESMEVIEALAKENQNEDGLGEYVRPEEAAAQAEDSFASKTKEIDLLWQSFKPVQFPTNSPVVYVLAGLAAGVLISVICFIILGLAVTKSGKGLHIGNKALFAPAASVETSIEDEATASEENVDAKISIPVDESGFEETSQDNSGFAENSGMKKYIVKDGDTVESIIIKNYGSYSSDKADAIMKANNMKSLDMINIDQELLIPVQ